MNNEQKDQIVNQLIEFYIRSAKKKGTPMEIASMNVKHFLLENEFLEEDVDGMIEELVSLGILKTIPPATLKWQFSLDSIYQSQQGTFLEYLHLLTTKPGVSFKPTRYLIADKAKLTQKNGFSNSAMEANTFIDLLSDFLKLF